jgi:hypothetical protein
MYQNRLNLVISSLDGLLGEDEMTMLMDDITMGLGVNNP